MEKVFEESQIPGSVTITIIKQISNEVQLELFSEEDLTEVR